jgi:hypothetical protein
MMVLGYTADGKPFTQGEDSQNKRLANSQDSLEKVIRE